ncbi:hypothetical protein, partial [Klebsiella oxytoca]|uniref:hypothetical protein n=1 Tax=Klebsiella oxytoca TaxID=571 RepID=UPI001C2D9DBE
CGVSPCESRELPGIKSTRKPHAKAWGFFVYLLFVGERYLPHSDSIYIPPLHLYILVILLLSFYCINIRYYEYLTCISNIKIKKIKSLSTLFKGV